MFQAGPLKLPEVSRPEKLHAITSLRFFAALFVVCFHSITVYSVLPFIDRDSWVGKFFSLGYTSVSFFFLLSGYILAIVYLRHGQSVDIVTFFRARFARIYPLLMITLLADLPFRFEALPKTVSFKDSALKIAFSFAGNAALLRAWTLKWRDLNEPSWSLSAEAVFYLLFPFIGVALWKLRGTLLWLSAGALYVGGQSFVFLVARHTQGELLKRLPLVHITTFALGILLARWQTLRREKDFPRRNSGHFNRYLVVSLVTMGSIAIVYWCDAIPLWSLHDGVLAPFFMATIWAFSQARWPPSKLLSKPWLVVLGEASFGLYLIHMPLFHLFDYFGWNRIPAVFPAYLALSIILSVLSFHWLETPARRWILKRGQSPFKEGMEMASDAQ